MGLDAATRRRIPRRQVVDPERRSSACIVELRLRQTHSFDEFESDAQAGKRGGRVLDEFALHPDPRKLWSIAYPGITWGGALEVISTHPAHCNFFNGLIREVRERNTRKASACTGVTGRARQGFLYKLQQTRRPTTTSRRWTRRPIRFRPRRLR